MTLTLTVDGDRWRGHLRELASATPGLVPVLKGNGYGFGLSRLARRAQWLHDQGLGVDCLAVGTYDELPEVAQRFHGDLLVMTPWRPFGAALDIDDHLAQRVIHTVSRPEDAHDLLTRRPDARFVVEVLTSMRRHGHTRRSLDETVQVLRDLDRHPRIEGVAIHLPLASGSHLGEVRRLVNTVVGAELRTRRLWVSHLTRDELGTLRSTYQDFEVRPRVGTSLWLGDRGALRVTGTVLDVHALERGEVFGYRGRSAPKAGHLLVVSGGTAHGIGLEAPTGDTSIKARAATLARGGLDAVGFVRSPYSIDGKQRLFAEPPHMQASMLFLPQGARVPAVGDEIDVRVRYTATSFDRVVVT
ncbi:alanine racemase [Nocardioides coralli]|uniref:alanine racemase n=1 Tax=Nocardioides coralli TaxID=2872154 RepID=UPI001CA462EF|nr:alanine racemase [Nocardioides coralli]QZY29134.1 alanine racemase [Nocardioides coralli]